MRVLILALCISLFSAPAYARGDDQKKKDSKGHRERTYEAPFDQVWDASLRAATKEFQVTYSNKEAGAISFEVGQTRFVYGQLVSATLTKISDSQTRVSLRIQSKKWQVTKWGGENKLAKTFFGALDDELKVSASSSKE
jgi:hypothetical protein